MRCDMKVAVTGAGGMVGRFVIRELLEQGYEVRAVTLEPWADCPVEQKQADMLNYEQVLDSFAGCGAVIHLAAFPSPVGRPETTVFHNNVMGLYHMLLAAGETGIARVAIASSDCAYGVTYSFQDTRPLYFPVDERHPAAPDNCYGLSKQVGEQVAGSLAKRFGMKVSSLRITYVVDPQKYDAPSFIQSTEQPDREPWNLWSYLDGRDCARAFRLAIEATFDGHEVFNIAAADHRCVQPTEELLSRYYPEIKLTRAPSGHESLLDCSKAKRMLGFAPQYSWRR